MREAEGRTLMVHGNKDGGWTSGEKIDLDPIPIRGAARASPLPSDGEGRRSARTYRWAPYDGCPACET